MFQPGVSGNPAGRPKSIVSDAYRRVLQREVPNDAQGRKYLDAVAEKVVALAIKGDLKAIAEITDRVDGKAVQAVELGGRGGGPMQFADVSPAENMKAIMDIVAMSKGKGGAGNAGSS